LEKKITITETDITHLKDRTIFDMGFDDVLFQQEHSSLKSEVKNIKAQMIKNDQFHVFKNETASDIKDINSNIDEMDNQNNTKIIKLKNELQELKNIKDLVGKNRPFNTIGDCIKET